MKILINFIMVLSSVLAIADDHVEPPELTQLREYWQAARDKILTPIDTEYRSKLIKLKEKFTKADKLDQALDVSKEIDRIKEVPEKSIPFVQIAKSGKTKELSELNKNWIEKRNRSVKPVDDLYKRKLSQLSTKHASQNNLEAALAIREEIKKLSQTSQTSISEKEAKRISKKLEHTKWSWVNDKDSRNKLSFGEDGKGRFGWFYDFPTTWKIIGKNRVQLFINSKHGKQNVVLKFDDKFKSFECDNYPNDEPIPTSGKLSN